MVITKMRSKYSTLKDVAALAEVSVATVSFVLNETKNSRISDETRQRVIKAAKELNYRPDINAQILKGRASSTVGLIIPCMRNNFYPEMTTGVTDRANELGYNVALFNTCDDFEKEVMSFDTLISMRAAGIMVVGVVQEDARKEKMLIEKTNKLNMPVICVDRYYEENIVSSVSINQFKASYDITSELIKSGYRDIAVVMPSKIIYTMKERLAGVRQAMVENGIVLTNDMLFYTDNVQYKDAHICADKILGANRKFSAILCVCGDVVAVKIIMEIKKRGLKVPEDIAVAGFDGIEMGEIISPTLTTVEQPIYDLGYEAMSMLYLRIDDLAGKDCIKNIRLPYSIKTRKSTSKY